MKTSSLMHKKVVTIDTPTGSLLFSEQKIEVPQKQVNLSDISDENVNQLLDFFSVLQKERVREKMIHPEVVDADSPMPFFLYKGIAVWRVYEIDPEEPYSYIFTMSPDEVEDADTYDDNLTFDIRDADSYDDALEIENNLMVLIDNDEIGQDFVGFSD